MKYKFMNSMFYIKNLFLIYLKQIQNLKFLFLIVVSKIHWKELLNKKEYVFCMKQLINFG